MLPQCHQCSADIYTERKIQSNLGITFLVLKYKRIGINLLSRKEPQTLPILQKKLGRAEFSWFWFNTVESPVLELCVQPKFHKCLRTREKCRLIKIISKDRSFIALAPMETSQRGAFYIPGDSKICPSVRSISQCIQRISMPETKTRHAAKFALKNRDLACSLCIPEMIYKSKDEHTVYQNKKDIP